MKVQHGITFFKYMFVLIHVIDRRRTRFLCTINLADGPRFDIFKRMCTRCKRTRRQGFVQCMNDDFVWLRIQVGVDIVTDVDFFLEF